MKAASVYVRVSTGKQADSGLGAEAQEHACRQWASANDYTVQFVFRDDGLSGSLSVADRPGLLDAIGCLNNGDVLLVAKRDRLARDVIVSALAERMVLARGATIVSAAGEGSDLDGPTGALVRTILDAVAQFERASAAMRTRAAMAAKRRRGEFCGGRAPYGYARDGDRLTEHPAEQAVIAHARALCDSTQSYTAIARHLGAAGFHTRAGTTTWHPQQIARMLKETDR